MISRWLIMSEHFVKSDCLRLEKIETSYCNSKNCETIRFVSFFLYPWVVSLRPLIVTVFWYVQSLRSMKNFLTFKKNAACASTLNVYYAYWADELFWWHVISHDLIHLQIFYSLGTTPKSVHCKHPDLFTKFYKRLIVKLGMCQNTCI